MLMEAPSRNSSMATDLPNGIFLSCWGFFWLLSLVIIVSDSSSMLPFPITRIEKDWTYMWMRTFTIRILPSRQYENPLALGHCCWSDLLMVLIHNESVLCELCEGLKCRVSHTTPSQPPVPWEAAAWPTNPSELSCNAPSAQCPAETVWETQQWCSEEHRLKLRPSNPRKSCPGAGTPWIS